MTAPAITTVRPHPARSGRQAIYDYLAVLTGGWDEGLLELRYRLDGERLARRFYSARRAAGMVEAITRLGSRSDVYVGCAPRARRAGGRAAIDHVHAAWVDCDTTASVAALAGFRPTATMTVRSGPVGRHGYWALAAPVSPEQVEAVNGRLAQALGADLACRDAARILRPPGTRNFKYEPAAPVTLEQLDLGRRYALAAFAALPATAVPPAGARRGRREGGGDPLLALTPVRYVEALLGRPVGRDGKIACPFHADAQSSLHVYRQPEEGWYCFSCLRGGSVYDLAAAVWGYETSGREFLQLRARLRSELLDAHDQRDLVAASLVRCSDPDGRAPGEAK